MKHSITHRVFLSLTICAALVFTSMAPSCSKNQLVASANDVLNVVTDRALNDALAKISPFAVAKLAKIIPSARELVDAVKNGDTSNAVSLVNTIFPVIDDIASTLGANDQVMAILAIANISLHFLLNHLPSTAIKAAKAKGSTVAVSAENFKNERAWGCDPKFGHSADKRCAVLAH